MFFSVHVFDNKGYFKAGGTGPLWIPVPTKLFHNGGSGD